MLLHISTRRNVALDLLRRGFVTQAEAAQLLGESRQALRYMARDIDARAARAKYLNYLWRTETTRHAQTEVRARP
jgi:hypothetical protein